MKKKIFLVAGIITVVLLCLGIYVYSQDNYRFKLSYEIYNSIEYNNGKKIPVEIPFDNKIKYVGEKDLKDVLTTKTGVVLFGYSTCQWCRNAIPVLIETVQKSKIETIYYVDVEAVNTESIKEILNPYLREDDEQNKRLYVPDVYFIKDGEILDHHIGTVESYRNAFQKMNEEQKQELQDIYQAGIDKILGDDKNEE